MKRLLQNPNSLFKQSMGEQCRAHQSPTGRGLRDMPKLRSKACEPVVPPANCADLPNRRVICSGARVKSIPSRSFSSAHATLEFVPYTTQCPEIVIPIRGDRTSERDMRVAFQKPVAQRKAVDCNPIRLCHSCQLSHHCVEILDVLKDRAGNDKIKRRIGIWQTVLRPIERKIRRISAFVRNLEKLAVIR